MIHLNILDKTTHKNQSISDDHALNKPHESSSNSSLPIDKENQTLNKSSSVISLDESNSASDSIVSTIFGDSQHYGWLESPAYPDLSLFTTQLISGFLSKLHYYFLLPKNVEADLKGDKIQNKIIFFIFIRWGLLTGHIN